MPPSLRALAHPSSVLCAWAEPLLRGRRVALLGEASSGLGALLAERGARLVHTYDPDPLRVAEALARAGRGAGYSQAVAVLDQDLGVRDGAFDVVLVPDLSLFEDARDIVRRARRLLSAQGVALLATPNPEAKRSLLPRDSFSRLGSPLGYYELFDLASLQFEVVRMVGQAPFVGYAVAEFAPAEEPAVGMDTSLLAQSEEPEWFLAVGSDRPLALESFTVVELPLELLEEARLQAGASDPGGLEDDRLALAEAERRLQAQGAELEGLRERERERSRELETRQLQLTAAETRAAELQQALEASEREAAKLPLDEEQRRLWRAEVERAEARARSAELERRAAEGQLAELEARLTQEGARATEAEARAEAQTRATEEARAEAQGAKAEVAGFEQALKEQRGQVEQLARQLEEQSRRAASLEQERRAREAVEEELRVLKASATEASRMREASHELEHTLSADHTAEVDALERTLRERGASLAEALAALHEAEAVGRELLEELDGARAQLAALEGLEARRADDGVVASLRSQLDNLALEAARAEANLQASSWKVLQLEQRLAQKAKAESAEPSATQKQLEQALVAARQELAQLRASMAPSL